MDDLSWYISPELLACSSKSAEEGYITDSNLFSIQSPIDYTCTGVVAVLELENCIMSLLTGMLKLTWTELFFEFISNRSDGRGLKHNLASASASFATKPASNQKNSLIMASGVSRVRT
ncbi:hypothetical protein EZV62_011970 [Acer yangbiense]|uniref:Uncharacterized protein n=1 Tax=Acer yangbiense TaxID=1000413 RepID=A0A5C7I9C7_9ROSI|nr:hypothetical protein EZV62_011970 [Acer yangbiense]